MGARFQLRHGAKQRFALALAQFQAGRLDAVTVGLNWYLNANAKLQFNYDVAHRGDTDNAAQGTIHSLGTRCAFDF